MLVEMANVKQIEKESYRRWFASEYFDLIVWYDRAIRIKGFQLCYNKFSDERAVTWFRKKGFTHKKVDDGEASKRLKMSPILVPDGIFPRNVIAERFRSESKNIDSKVAEFVYSKILKYPL